MLRMPVPYDPAWPDRFLRYRADLSAATGVDAAQILHIGSTAVPGLRAKPIIDIQIGVTALDLFEMPRLTAAGFETVDTVTADDPFRATGRPGDWAKRFARREVGGRRVAHVHVRELGRPNHRFALLFRDFLRHDPETCRIYGDFKEAAARIAGGASGPGGTGGYLDLKDPVVQLIAARAEDWALRNGWTAPVTS